MTMSSIFDELNEFKKSCSGAEKEAQMIELKMINLINSRFYFIENFRIEKDSESAKFAIDAYSSILEYIANGGEFDGIQTKRWYAMSDVRAQLDDVKRSEVAMNKAHSVIDELLSHPDELPPT